MIKIPYVIAIALFCFIFTSSISHAQTLEPRAYSNAPVGMNFLVLGYQNSKGALLFDPAVPITDADDEAATPICIVGDAPEALNVVGA